MLGKLTASITVVLCLAAGAPQPLQAAEGDRSVEALAERLVTQLAEPGPQSAAEIRERIDNGVPPGALVVWLDAYRGAPRYDLLDVVSSLASYRRVEVRGRALAALAANEGTHSLAAIELAATDGDETIRRLAIGLAKRHPSATADEIVGRLLARDPALAAEVAESSVPEIAAAPTAEAPALPVAEAPVLPAAEAAVEVIDIVEDAP